LSEQTIKALSGEVNFKEIAEKYGRQTVKEMMTSTSGLALAQLVAARAAIQLLTRVDARELCRRELIPPGAGMTHHFQFIKIPADLGAQRSESLSVDATAKDLELEDKDATLVQLVARTDISDLVQRQATVNVANAVGIGHGNVMNYLINKLIYAQINAATTSYINKVRAASSINYTFSDIFDLIGYVEDQRAIADTFVTYPIQAAKGVSGEATGFFPFVKTNISSVQFTGALQEYLKMGVLPQICGLKIFRDSSYKPVTASADGAVMGAVLQSGEAIGWADAEDVMTEIQRWAPQVGFRVVTHVTGAAKLIADPFVALLKHTNS
jgi:hypothetical protein